MINDDIDDSICGGVSLLSCLICGADVILEEDAGEDVICPDCYEMDGDYADGEEFSL